MILSYYLLSDLKFYFYRCATLKAEVILAKLKYIFQKNVIGFTHNLVPFSAYIMVLAWEKLTFSLLRLSYLGCLKVTYIFVGYNEDELCGEIITRSKTMDHNSLVLESNTRVEYKSLVKPSGTSGMHLWIQTKKRNSKSYQQCEPYV